jgi:hypothetical protein
MYIYATITIYLLPSSIEVLERGAGCGYYWVELCLSVWWVISSPLAAATGGDAMLTACVWEAAGIAPTAPDPLWHPDALSAFDASSPLLPDPSDGSRRAGRGVPVKVSRALGNLLSAAVSACNTLCQVPLFVPCDVRLGFVAHQ